ncbi:MAG TPA: CDP-alcohol phosphatidyltransferase family protein [Acidiferrobacteraceae bacterium]|nr:CDP-alcohol phosphatidyltransferase family protein [Acidiferrobacteraceae bacterium]
MNTASLHVLIITTRSPLRPVAGLPLLVRNVLAATSIGVGKVTILSDLAITELAPALQQIQSRNPKLSLNLSSAPQWVDHCKGTLNGDRILLLHTDGAVTPAWIKALLQDPCGPDEILSYSCGANDHDHMLLDVAHLSHVLVTLAQSNSITTEGLYRQIASIAHPRATNKFNHAAYYGSIVTATDVAKVEKQLFRRLTKKSDGYISRYFNRPLSTSLSRQLAPFNISPMQLTWVTAFFGIAMFLAFIGGQSYSLILGCILFQVASVADGMDGEIARVKYLASTRGAAWDTSVDMATNLLFIIGLMSALHLQYGPNYLHLGIYLVAVSSAAITLLSLLVYFGPGGGSFDVVGQALVNRLAAYPRTQTIITVVEKFFKRDAYAFIFALLGIIGLAYVIPWMLAVGVSLWLLAVIINTPYILKARPADILPEHIKNLRP